MGGGARRGPGSRNESKYRAVDSQKPGSSMKKKHIDPSTAFQRALAREKRRDQGGRCIGCGRYVRAGANVCPDCDPEDYRP